MIGWALLPSWMFLGSVGILRAAEEYVPSSIRPPGVAREFRATWIATVSNIDWPSQRGLSTAQQKAELIAILDRATLLKLNVVILQVRPSCDAFYASAMEPWSEYLTGRMGQAPKPYYDPLTFALEEAHKRGLELHAWFNPYRARHSSAKGPILSGHIMKTRPGLVRRYGGNYVLDPGEAAVEDYSRSVILDVVRRYDIDGVHIDDYFYPYPEKTAEGRPLEFPDAATYQRYRKSGGSLNKEEWRRRNVDDFVRTLYQAIKREKAWVKFGVSPFGIWHSGTPSTVKGLSARDEIYADSRKWLQEGWLDYLAPQLYWRIGEKDRSFLTLLEWWGEQNVRNRLMVPGIRLVERDGTVSAYEILRQIQATRAEKKIDGQILWSSRALIQNQGGIAGTLATRAYRDPVLVPAFPWLEAGRPAAPKVTAVTQSNGSMRIGWSAEGPKPVGKWVIQTRQDGQWATKIYPEQGRSLLFGPGAWPDVMGVSAVDRFGNAGPPTVVQRSKRGGT